MHTHRKMIFAALLLLIVSAAGVQGCGGRQDNGRPQAQNAGRGAAPLGNDRAGGTTASHLERLARSVNGVKGANCVVFGRYAIVGIDVDPAMERSRVGTVKYAVAEAFRKDPRAIGALVTADVDLAQRVREIRADIRQGHPVAGFADELADIVGRLVPQIPRNIVPPASPENTGAPQSRADRT